MKKIVILLVSVFFVTACGNKGGVGSGGSKKGFEAQPENMIPVPRGSFEMGSNDEDVVWAMNAPLRRRTVDAFWMDQTEVTNLAYRQFVGWTTDSIARRILSKGDDAFIIEEEDDEEDVDEDEVPLNYKPRIAMSPKQKGYDDHYPALKEAEFFYSRQDALGQKRVIDPRNIYYKYRWYDLQKAALSKWDPETKRYTGTTTDAEGNTVEIEGRNTFIVEENVAIYPDTLVWIRDFHLSFNDPMAVSYFWHPGYDYYPVVGVSWKQATAFCDWRSRHAKEKRYRNQYPPLSYRLPTEVEFEYASRGGLEGNLYPWGSMYNSNQSGCFLANFKPQRGDYSLDGFTRTAPVAQYEPNEFGLYDMAGNVSEWVSDAYDENAYEATHDLVPVYHYNAKTKDKPSKKRKVVRGGSWKDFAYFLQCGARNYEGQDSTRSYIGFRTVRDIINYN
ncbi:MAG: formylglycine-generating enzyme family protein [Prevotellaceae bacterium]|jgi:gliding motility-associated lipoprotein GldK|nr:formylglycine-generating enzyme family protein [Prevotellaceae bacterium]